MVASKKAAFDDDLVSAIVRGIDEKKGKNTAVIDLREIENSICDYYVVCHGTSNTNVDAIAESIIDVVREEQGEKPRNVEGKREAQWIVVDFFNVMVHVFQEEYREHYAIEELWADAEIEFLEE